MSGPAFNPDVPPVPLGPEGSVLTIVQGSPRFPATQIAGSPGTIADLYWWLRADTVLGTNGIPVPILGNATPWILGPLAALTTGAVTVSATALANRTVLTWPGSASGRYVLNNPVQFSGQFTIAAVVNPSGPANQTLLGAGNSGLEVDVNSGVAGLSLTKASIAVIASSTGNMVAGVWTQFNATYNAGSGAFAFRIAKAAAGSGVSGTTGITNTTSGLGFNVSVGGNDLSSSVAEMAIFGRILTPTELTALESYYSSKWGV